MNTGGPAFPLQTWDSVIHSPKTETGMTLRDYFAAKAMQAAYEQGVHPYDMLDCAARAYQMADAMLKARNE